MLKVVFREFAFRFLAESPRFRQFMVASRARYLFVLSIVLTIRSFYSQKGTLMFQITLVLNR